MAPEVQKLRFRYSVQPRQT